MINKGKIIKKNLFFFIYQELEFHNFFPTALEIKRKYSDFTIYFVFTNFSKYKEIVKHKFIEKELKKNFKLYVFKGSKNYITQKFFSITNNIKLLLKLMFGKKTLIFFPRLSMLNQDFIVYLCKFFGGKIIYLSPDRFCHSTSLMNREQFKKGIIDNKKKINFFDYFVFFNKDNFIYNYIKNLHNTDSKKIIHIGLPNMYSTWKNLIKKAALQIKKNLIHKHKSYSSIYTIIGGKDGDSQFLKSNKSQHDSLLRIINNLCLNDPKCLILFKGHPRQPMPIYLKKVLEKIKSKKIIQTSVNVDILSLISKRFFFTSPTGVLTHTQNVKKIDFSDYRKKFNKNFFKGYRVLHINSKNSSTSEKLNKLIFDDKFFSDKRNYNKEVDLIKKNYPKIHSLIKEINN